MGEDSTAPYEIALHTKDISVGLHEIKASIISEGMEDVVTVEKEPKGKGDSGGDKCSPGQHKKGLC